MFFYKMEVESAEREESTDRRKREEQAAAFRARAEEVFASAGRACCIFVSSVQKDKLICGAIARRLEDMERAAPLFMKKMGLHTETAKITEITMKSLFSLVNCADRGNYIEDRDELLSYFDLDDIDCGRRSFFTEYILGKSKSLAQLKKQACGLPGERGLIQELDRVFSPAKPSAPIKGHPVHYIIQAEDKLDREKTLDILLNALFSNGRINSRRCCTVDWPPRWGDMDRQLELLYASSDGGVIAIDCRENTLGDEEEERILLRCMRKHKNHVLTVFCLPKDECPLPEKLGSFPMVELREDRLSRDDAKKYLKRLAGAQGIGATKALYQSMGCADGGYRPSALNSVFDAWFESRLKTDYYPQYADIGAQTGVKAENADSAYQQLQKMVGLDRAKAVIGQALDFFTLQGMRVKAGAAAGRPAMHMVFTGNPGTAKTTVARLFARIMKENGLMERGELYELGRADLVARYVGWTAKTVKEKFRQAKGGVLFIDEAYSLVDDRGGSFGDEAINTIVQEMENNRDDTIVIFAGYPDKMEQFLARNPGLRSRIAFHVPFPDYSVEELYEICGLIAKEKGLTLATGTQAALMPILTRAREQDDFGNGRFARNLIEKAHMKQASRLVKMSVKSATKEQLSTLTAEDFQMPEMKPRQSARRIGFAI